VSDAELNLREAVIAARERLGALAERLARARGRLGGSAVAKPAATPGAPPPPFGGVEGRPIDDLELTFRAVDVGQDQR
jgi:hypothetical protein